MNKLNLIQDTITIGGIALSIPIIESILGVILLSLNILILLYRGGYRIYEHIKKKEFDKIDDALEETRDEIEKLTDKEKK